MATVKTIPAAEPRQDIRPGDLVVQASGTVYIVLGRVGGIIDAVAGKVRIASLHAGSVYTVSIEGLALYKGSVILNNELREEND